MVPFVDLHVHLLAALDDGPRTLDDAVTMCRMASAEGVRAMAATSHQNQRWSEVTPDIIRTKTDELRNALRSESIPVILYPNAEITAQPETGQFWDEGRLLSVADQGQYLLVEMPHGSFVDLTPVVKHLRKSGLRTILAHPEKEMEFLHGNGLIEKFIDMGCLVQVSSASITDPKNKEDFVALKSWFKRGVVHLLASDGHSPKRRPPLMAAAHREICHWIGTAAAERISSSHGVSIVSGDRVRVPRPAAARRKQFWFAWWEKVAARL
jgi:protein-tyrosine phosphatase